jgi:hypothetical protein
MSARGSRWLFSILAVVAACGASGCDDKKNPSRPPEEPPLPPRPPTADSAVLDAGLEDAAAAAAAQARKLVADLRGSKLDVAARRVPTERVAFAKDRLAQLTDDALVVHDTKSWKVTSRLPVTEGRRVIPLPDGTLLVATKSEVIRVPADLSKAEHYSRIPLFMDSLLFADKREKKKLWVLHGIDPTLYPYELGDEGRLDALDFLPLESFDQKGFTALKDGSFVYTAGSSLHRFFPGGKTWKLALPEGTEVWRVLTTRRLDQIWIARSDGKVQLVQLGPERLSLVETLELPGAFDIASNDSELAILRLAEPSDAGADSGAPRRTWTLAVFDSSGKEQMRLTLPFERPSGSDDDWVRDVTKNRAVVLSSQGPVVAVGGPSWLAAWNTKTQQPLLEP